MQKVNTLNDDLHQITVRFLVPRFQGKLSIPMVRKIDYYLGDNISSIRNLFTQLPVTLLPCHLVTLLPCHHSQSYTVSILPVPKAGPSVD